MTKRLRSLALRVVGLGASVFVLWRIGEWSQLGLIIRDVSPFVLALALALAVASVWVTGLRWWLLDPDPAGQLRQWDYFRYSVIGLTANLFMPGALGGDAVRAALVARDLDRHRGVAVAAIITDRWIGLLSIMLLGTLACLAAPRLESRRELLSALIATDLAFVAAGFIAGSRRLSEGLLALVDRPGKLWSVLDSVLRAWREAFVFYAGNTGRVLGALLLCLPIHTSWFLVVYLLATQVGIHLSFVTLSLVSALSWVITAVPISIGGLGLREISFAYLLSLQGVDPEPAVVLGGFVSAVFVSRAILGVPLFWFGRPNVTQTPPPLGSA